MQIEFAPMEGFTDYVYRRAQRLYFPDAHADAYYVPFLSPTKDHIITPKQRREILPENNPGAMPVPQALGCNAEDFLWLCGELAAMGYETVNLNLGCPSGTVVAKGKGAGFLRDPDALDRFLDTVYAASPIRISIKTRLGMQQPEEFYRLLEIYNRYPLEKLIIHPRVQKESYQSIVHRDIFATALRDSKNPVEYNGNLFTAEDCRGFCNAYPQVCGIMLGRGLLANPALIRQLRGGAPADKATLRAFAEELFARYTELFGRPESAIRRMKGVWTYLICLFDGHEQLDKALRKVTAPCDYFTLVDCIFSQLPLLPDAKNVP